MCLNLCSWQWFRPTCSCLVNLISLWLSQLRPLLGEVVINLRILFLKTPKLFEFWRRDLIFHSVFAEEKKEFVSNFKRHNVISSSHSICIGFLRFWFKKLLKIFVFVEVSCIAPVLAKQALYWIDSSFCWKDLSQTQS